MHMQIIKDEHITCDVEIKNTVQKQTKFTTK
jgi:hypothetical protein